MKYELKCSGCTYRTIAMDNQYIAQAAAEMHVMLGPNHVVTCTTPEHNQERAAAKVVFVVKHKKS